MSAIFSVNSLHCFLNANLYMFYVYVAFIAFILYIVHKKFKPLTFAEAM